MYETALHMEAKRRVREIGSADLVVGIPTYRNGRTVGRVMEATVTGLARDFPNARAVIVNADGGSSDNTTQITAEWSTPTSVKKIITPYEGLLGRGSAVRAIFEVAAALGSKVCIVLSPDARDISPGWLSALAAPILAGQCDLVLSDYDRPPLEGAISDHVVFPMVQLLYGVTIRQAAGCELAIRSNLAGQYALRDVWETDIARYGLDVWLTITSLIEERRLGQVDLGTKYEGMRDFVVPLDPRFQQSVGTLFRMVSIYRRSWTEPSALGQMTTFGAPKRGVVTSSRNNTSLEAIWEAALKGRNKFRGTWRQVLASDHLDRIREAFKAGPSADAIPAELWARVVIDFAVVYNKGEGDPDKVVCALLPIYYARIVSYMLETQSAPPEAYDEGIQTQAALFEAQRPYLQQRWITYVPWLGERNR